MTIKLDSDGLKYEGLTGDFPEWNQRLNKDFLNKYSLNYAQDSGVDKEDIKSLIVSLFEMKEKDISRLNKLTTEYSLDSCEYNYCKNRLGYAIYTFLWTELLQMGYSINSDAYQFMYDLPLDDIEAAKSSLDYNRAIFVFIFLKLRIENEWYEHNSFDPKSDTFNNLYYEKIITEIKDEDVKNITLTRKVISLLNSGSTSAIPLFKKYLNDCSDSFYKTIAFRYYNNYLKIKNYSKQALKIEELNGSLFEELKQHKGKVLYVDFWASSCSPCLENIPYTKKLQEKYMGQEFEVIYVNINDNIGAFESTAQKLGLKDNLIYLDKNQSTEIRKILQIQGIPHYMLIDKQGIIIERKAPDPKSGTIEVIINKLLN